MERRRLADILPSSTALLNTPFMATSRRRFILNFRLPNVIVI
ncbi:hypothetical protein [Kingella sp. (in: b-proteobacteria)]|nr:hypothetical protein [Kingella sp. (in: b-proteobacteria)]MDO4658134.1 hypothetical protein [Kingella sp. (in: b-proteobacteria)]